MTSAIKSEGFVGPCYSWPVLGWWFLRSAAAQEKATDRSRYNDGDVACGIARPFDTLEPRTTSVAL